MKRLLVLILLVALSGCGRDDGVVRVTIWHQKVGPERDFFEQVVEEYNESHTDHQIQSLYRENEENRNLFIIASAGGQGPDIIYGPADNVSILATTETIRPVTDVMSSDYLGQFTDEGLVAWDGSTWLVADQVGNHLTFVYNKALMPEPPATIDEMIAVLQELTVDQDGDGKVDRYGLTWNYREPYFFIPFLTAFGGWMMDDNGNPTLDTEATVKAIQFILDLRDRYKVIPASTDYDTSETMFKSGIAAAIINGPWSWAGYGQAGVDYGLARIPFMSETGNWSAPIKSAKGYSVNVNVSDEKLPYVQRVLAFLTGPEMQTRMAGELATVPVIASVRETPQFLENEFLQASLQQLEVAREMPTEPQLRQIWDGMRGPYQLVMNGAVTAEEGAKMMQADVEKRIRDAFL